MAAGINNPVMQVSPMYETVAAGQTAQVLGTNGATGDFISGILVVPTGTPGNVTLIDGSTSIVVFTGTAATVAPVYIPLGIFSTTGPWKITTGSNVTAIAMGSFSV